MERITAHKIAFKYAINRGFGIVLVAAGQNLPSKISASQITVYMIYISHALLFPCLFIGDISNKTKR